MVLKGQKVILRPIMISDAFKLVKWLNDQEITKFLQARRHFTLARERQWLKKELKNNSRKSFAITTNDGVHIGLTDLTLTKDHNRAVFGIFIGDKNYWNQGLGSEAARLILDYGFKQLKLHRVELGVLEYNPRP